MKPLGYAFAILGIVALIAILIGYTQHLLSLAVCGLMAYAILGEKEDAKDDERAGSE